MLAKWPIVRRARYAKVYISLQRCRKMSFLEGDVHGWLGRAAKRGFDNKKAPNTGSFLNLNGGGGGIRTLVTLYRPNGFRDRRIQPLCHPSAGAMRPQRGAISKRAWKRLAGLVWRRDGDSNPRYPFGAYTISNRAPSASSDISPHSVCPALRRSV